MDNIFNFYQHIESNHLNKSILEECARMLMGRYCVKKKDAYYQIAEIEFYYYGPNHRDIITYPRTCLEKQWFFHQSGVDLTIKSNQNGEPIQFGGILIRSIRKYDRGWNYIKTICGPQKCVNELFDVLDAFDNNNNLTPVIVETTKFGDVEICSSQRYIAFNVSKSELELQEGRDDKEKYQKAIKGKVETKFKTILKEYKKLVSKDGDYLEQDVNLFNSFCDYLNAEYRYYLRGIEWENGYKVAGIFNGQEHYKFLFLNR